MWIIKTVKVLQCQFRLLLLLGLFLASVSTLSAQTAKFEISYPEVTDSGPITGRVFVIISKNNRVEPRLQAGQYIGVSAPFFGRDVESLKPGEPAVIDASAPGYPVETVSRLPAGEYFVQALLSVYTRVRRKDGHTIWVHMDQWEGQQWNRSPGNLVSDVLRVRLDPASGFNVKLSLTKKLPAIQIPPDTTWVKRVKIQSKMLSEFWGHPMYLGATLLLPKGYDQNVNQKYPAIYIQGYFGLGAPFGFTDQAPANTETVNNGRRG